VKDYHSCFINVFMLLAFCLASLFSIFRFQKSNNKIRRGGVPLCELLDFDVASNLPFRIESIDLNRFDIGTGIHTPTLIPT